MGIIRDFTIGEFYHVYNRGTDKRVIFLDKNDYERFIMLLYLCNSDNNFSLDRITSQKVFSKDIFCFDRGGCLVDVVSICLMPNHFHLILRERVEGGISKFLQRLLGGYTTYFNIKNNRTGCLFQGKFKSKHINNDPYFRYLFAYIGLNPISIFQSDWKEKGVLDKKKAKKFLMNYKYSSYLDCVGVDRVEGLILNKEFLPDGLDNINDFSELVDDFYNYEE